MAGEATRAGHVGISLPDGAPVAGYAETLPYLAMVSRQKSRFESPRHRGKPEDRHERFRIPPIGRRGASARFRCATRGAPPVRAPPGALALGPQMAAEGKSFPWRLNQRMIFANLEIIWEISGLFRFDTSLPENGHGEHAFPKGAHLRTRKEWPGSIFLQTRRGCVPRRKPSEASAI